MVEVVVRYWAGARQVAGCDEERCEAVSVRDVVDQLRDKSTALLEVLQRSSLLVDGRVVDLERDGEVGLSAGQVLEVLPPFAGG